MTYRWESERGDVVTFTMDMEKIMQRFAVKALYSKSGKAGALHGLIKAVVTEKNPANYCECGRRYGGHKNHGKSYCLHCRKTQVA